MIHSFSFLARLHFSAERAIAIRSASASASTCKMLGQMLKSWNFSLSVFFSCILTLLIILIKPLTTKAHDRRASGDCGTSGYFYSNNDPRDQENRQQNRFSERCFSEKKLQPVEFESMAWLTAVRTYREIMPSSCPLTK